MIRLLIADDHPVVRQGLRRIVDDCPDIAVVGELQDGDQVLAILQTSDADVLLLDISMPGLGFLELMQQIGRAWPRLKVLVLSVHPEDQYAVRALRAGAVGYLTKSHSPEELAEAIRRIYRGGRYVTPTLAEKLAFELRPEAGGPAHESLSDREFQVLCLVGAGKSLKEIAAELAVSPKTVSTYRARILEKMQLRSTADLIRYAVEHELVL